MLSNILDRISFWALFVVVVLLPVFFLPFTKIPIEISKGLFLIVGLSVAIIFWTAARFSDGKITLPKSWLLVSGLGIVLAFLISAICSPAMRISFFGTMFDTGTFYFILACFLLMFFSSLIFKEHKKIRMVFWGSIMVTAVVFLFQAFHLFFVKFLSFGLLETNTDNLLGTWSTFGIFAGLSALVSLFVIEFFSIGKVKKILLTILLIISLVFIILVNYTLVWIILGIFTLALFVYKVSFFSNEQRQNRKSFPIASFVVIMLSLLFLIAGNFIGGFLPDSLGISNPENRLSFSSTMSVARETLVKNPILGSGPNRFNEMWALHKPAEINFSRFWDTSFTEGYGVLPTFIITTGILGILAWLSFIFFLVLAGIKFFLRKKDSEDKEIAIFFMMAIYLFIASFFYSIGPALLLLAFSFLGIFIGLLANKDKKEIQISFLNDPRKSFFSILLLVLVMLISAAACFKYLERFASVPYFQKTINAKNLNEAETSINKALNLYSNDLYLRIYVQVYLSRLDSLLFKFSKGTLSEIDKTDLKISFDKAVAGAQMAVQSDPNNFLNYESLSSVYALGAFLKVTDAYEKAIETSQKASALSPVNPRLKLTLARISFSNGDIKGAKDYTNNALLLKPDYLEALVIASQIAKSEGDNTSALTYAEKALSLAPENQELIQYVNSFKNSTISSSTTPSETVDTKDTKNKEENKIITQ